MPLLPFRRTRLPISHWIPPKKSKKSCRAISTWKELWKKGKRVWSAGSELSLKRLRNLKKNKNSSSRVKCNKSNKNSSKSTRSILWSRSITFTIKSRNTSYSLSKWKIRFRSWRSSGRAPSLNWERIRQQMLTRMLPAHSVIKLWQK